MLSLSARKPLDATFGGVDLLELEVLAELLRVLRRVLEDAREGERVAAVGVL